MFGPGIGNVHVLKEGADLYQQRQDSSRSFLLVWMPLVLVGHLGLVAWSFSICNVSSEMNLASIGIYSTYPSTRAVNRTRTREDVSTWVKSAG